MKLPTCAVLLLLPLATTLPVVAQQATLLTLGVYSFKKPTEVVRDFGPAIDELSRSMTAAAGRPITISLRVFKTYEECQDKFVAGEVDLVRFGPASYVLAKTTNAGIQLVVAEQEDGKKRCKGVIVVRQDSPIQSMKDLKGRSFAFGDQMSTIGRYLSQAEMVKANVFESDLSKHAYLERHDKVFKAVEVGDFDAGAVHIATFEDLNLKGQLRVIREFENAGKPWVARAGLDAALVESLRKALLGMTDAAALKALKVHGFLPTTDADFQIIRDGMKLSESFPRAQAEPQPKPDKD
jgi:phosphonate transport system substrate-binding protein